MNTYLIFMPNGAEHVEQEFPLHHTIESDTLWAIGTDLLTCADVWEKFEPTDASGVVVKFDEFYGLWNRALWDKIEAWAAAR